METNKGSGAGLNASGERLLNASNDRFSGGDRVFQSYSRNAAHSKEVRCMLNALRVQVDLQLPELRGASSASEVLQLAFLEVS